MSEEEKLALRAKISASMVGRPNVGRPRIRAEDLYEEGVMAKPAFKGAMAPFKKGGGRVKTAPKGKKGK